MNAKPSKLRIAIEAQLPENSGSGGVVSVLTGLIHALGRLDDGPEEYVIIGLPDHHEWLRPFMGPNQRLITVPRNSPRGLNRMIPQSLRGIARHLRQATLRRLFPQATLPQVPISNGFYESLGCDLIHFPHSYFAICGLPTIYNVHDLQHLTAPQFCTPETIRERDIIYPTACRVSRTVVAAAQWIKDDIIRHYGTPADKIQVISWATPTQAYSIPTAESLLKTQMKYELKKPFAFYPALTAPHKNHVRLLEAIALLRNRNGLKINLVCTGYQDFPGSAWPLIQDKIKQLQLEDQVHFLGLVPTEDMRPLYRLAEFAIIPPLSQGVCGPQAEAWAEHLPVACSALPHLVEAAGDAAVLFDPTSTESMAQAIERIATDAALRGRLRDAGIPRLDKYHTSWDRTAKSYRALYRQIAGFPLSAEGKALLEGIPKVTPERTVTSNL